VVEVVPQLEVMDRADFFASLGARFREELAA
jgi:hypothetical protein